MRQFVITLFSLIAAVGGFLITFVGGFWVYAFAPIAHPSVAIGYYGYYNRVQRVIKSIPDVAIVDTWQHTDLTIESFSFTLQRPNGKTVRVMFRESTPAMDFSDDRQIRDYVLMHLDHSSNQL
jgi:hypothetical protein